MQPLVVSARLRHGYSASDPWSPSLEAILANFRLLEQLGDEEFALGSAGLRPLIVCEDLPLERVQHQDAWWWSVSMPLPDPPDPLAFHRWFHRRFDLDAAASYGTPDTRKVNIRGGPWKSYRVRRTLTLARSLHWHCIGDAAEIRRLLRRCGHIGYGRAKGWGEVLEWTVSLDGARADWARFLRPLPVDYAARQGLSGLLLRWGIRPPGRLPEHQMLCVMPQDPRLPAPASDTSGWDGDDD